MPKTEMSRSRFCPFCRGATRPLNTKGVEFALHSVDGVSEKRGGMTMRRGGHSMPQVFINDQPVGGSDEPTAPDMDDDLDKLPGLGRQPSIYALETRADAE